MAVGAASTRPEGGGKPNRSVTSAKVVRPGTIHAVSAEAAPGFTTIREQVHPAHRARQTESRATRIAHSPKGHVSHATSGGGVACTRRTTPCASAST